MGDQFLKVFRKCVVVVALGRLTRFAESPAIVRDDSVSGIHQSGELLLPGSSAQGVSMDQNHGLTRSVVLIIELDAAGVFFSDCHIRHGSSPFSSGPGPLLAGCHIVIMSHEGRKRESSLPNFECSYFLSTDTIVGLQPAERTHRIQKEGIMP